MPIEDVPLIDGRRWYAWDGTELYGLAAAVVEASNWPERLGALLVVRDAARAVTEFAGATKVAIVNEPPPDDPGPVLLYVRDVSSESVMATRAEDLASLLDLLKLPPVSGDA
jgi:hypothetical protein